MQHPKAPPDEQERLRALRALEILDTPPEPSFDALTALASHLAGTPVALVSLVDEHRQWFKSHHGLAATETPREVSFCGHVVAEGAPLLVADASQDERFADNPLVTGEPRVLFYAGFPLRTQDGLVLGTLCAIDHRPRQLSPQQHEHLELLANQVAELLALRRQNLARREREQQLLRIQQAREEALHEKEVLVQELHHRVKNNLQMMISLLNLSIRDLAPGPARAILEESQQRLRAVALVHQRLYQSESFSRVAMGEYLRDLSRELLQATATPNVSLRLACDDVTLPMSQAIPCGMIVTELLTNAMKHAFPHPRAGHVEVALRVDGDQLCLRVTDDGVGLPNAVAESTETLGMRLVAIMARQLKATRHDQHQDGCCFAFHFAPLLG